MRSTLKVLGLGLALGGCIVGSSSGSNDTDIIGGTQDSFDDAVGVLRLVQTDGSVGVCTATLISDSVALTAAHCAGAPYYDISFDRKPDLNSALGGGSFILAQTIAHPGFTGNPLDGHDVAIVVLERAPGIDPVDLGDAPSVGSRVRAVGYGVNVVGSDGTGVGTRRQVFMPVTQVLAHEIVAGQDGKTTCHGDSGGPIFDLLGDLVATDSYGDTADCHGSSHDMIVADNRSFIDQFLTGGGGGGGGGDNTCEVTQNDNEIKCTNGSCTCYAGGQQYATCTAPDPSTACSSPGNCCGF